MVYVVISLLSFLILFIRAFSVFFLVSLARGSSIYFIFSKNQLLVSLIFSIVFVVSISFISTLIFNISYFLLTLGTMAGSQSHGDLSDWRDRAPGLTAAIFQLPMATGTTAAQRPESYVLPPLLLSGSLGLQAQLPWPEGLWYCRNYLCCSLSSISSMCSTPPPLGGQICEILPHPGVLGRSTFVAL